METDTKRCPLVTLIVLCYPIAQSASRQQIRIDLPPSSRHSQDSVLTRADAMEYTDTPINQSIRNGVIYEKKGRSVMAWLKRGPLQVQGDSPGKATEVEIKSHSYFATMDYCDSTQDSSGYASTITALRSCLVPRLTTSRCSGVRYKCQHDLCIA